jgi:hypothetical protein
MTTRRGFLGSFFSLTAIKAVPFPAVPPAKPATITMRWSSSPECMCGFELMRLAQEWEDRHNRRRMVCPNPKCANYGVVVLETLLEVEVLGRIPHRR